ncbi:class I SAM-dependent methyltransferase [Streptosporangium sp. NPDC000396]|uniref:class I SAM-dependent methyltransferase n=1 Tax=Streptosporangium sp. NPDC000396 TaxID=3366185 RepID=UPI0036A83A43
MTATYNSDTTKTFYNSWGANEWDRLESSLENRINYRIHRAMLAEFVRPGDKVLEAGAGPGRFTIELAKAGAEVTVCDLSDVQLGINREKVAEAGLTERVTSWHQADIVDLSRFESAAYDAVVCVGSVLSCVLDRVPDALAELVRVTKPGGVIIVSVTSRYGYLRAGLEPILELAGSGDQLAAIDDAVVTGDIVGITADMELLTTHFFTWAELKEALEVAGCEIAAASASNFLSADFPKLDALLEDPAVMEAFTRWELEACRAPGAIDGGTHIIAVARRLAG